MRAGRLNKKISWYSSSKNRGIPGAEVLTLVASTMAEILPETGKEAQARGTVVNSSTVRITMRYINNFKPSYVGFYNGKKFNIISVSNIGKSNRELQIVAQEVVT